ncbi:acyl-CoA dehydrogenase family protein [Allorhizobium taibaishanense]|uniref:Alkylation response protein AidB-like acyl-CoA dehydrogenase n=1 Tax=Allorhizobium taibaishanense TaxID=887144 RepID=A0A1Q9A6Y4_9HYPH|nr:acyl-CoA dehydrogenase family protein [Allorhizobium taibaishanense]MBB4008510.1 alkylation response protein AidB-like acyl-CoA dehydrogenase [Allorhizobium taibaishanense]OLP50331.1 hypothetical protein BJF91_13560 [Allorhizobium taibaishanense]
MGTFSPVFERPARPVALIKAEDEALTAAQVLADSALSEDHAEEQPRLDHLLRSGLLGISISTDYGGIDISNVLLSTVCRIVAEASPNLSAILAAHYGALELLRTHGSEAQKSFFFAAALAGMRFARAKAEAATSSKDSGLHLTHNGLGWSLNGTAIASPAAMTADWIMVSVYAPPDEPIHLFCPGNGSLTPIANTLSSGTHSERGQPVLFRDQKGEKDAVLQPRRPHHEPDVPQAMDLLLQASVELGSSKAFLAPFISPTSIAASATGMPFERLADAALRVATAEAVVEKAATAIDAAQIGASDRHRHTAFLIASAASVAAREASAMVRSMAIASTDEAAKRDHIHLGSLSVKPADAEMIVSLMRRGHGDIDSAFDDERLR